MSESEPEPETETETESAERVALTAAARRTVASKCVTFEARPEVLGWQREVLAECYGALMRHEGEHGIHDLRRHFNSYGTEEPKQGIYASPAKWYKDIGRSQLLELPGVEPAADGTSVEFVGIEANEATDVDGVTDEDLLALDEYRDAPRTRIRRALDVRYDPYGMAYADLLALADAVVEADGDVSPEDLDGDYKLPNLSDVDADELADLPHIERETVRVTSEDIALDDLDTLADLEAAKERVASGSETVYRFKPDADVGV